MPLTEDWDVELHREIIETLNKLEDGIDTEDPNDMLETPSGQPYCGCADCSVREILTIAMPRIVEAYKQGLIPEKALAEQIAPRTAEEKREFETAWRPSIVGSRTPEFDV